MAFSPARPRLSQYRKHAGQRRIRCLGLALALGLSGTALGQVFGQIDTAPATAAPATAAPAPAAQDAAAQALERQHDLALPSQPLGATLNALARRWAIPISVDAALIAGRSVPAIQGRPTLASALARSLAGSGLVAVPSGSALVIQRSTQGETTLPTVTVTGQASAASAALPKAFAGGQVARGARLGLLGNTDIQDAPFSVTSLTARLIEDQQARNLADLLGRNDPSVRVSGGEGSDTDTLLIRGFAVGMEDSLFNGLPGLLSYYRSKVEFVERVEVLKGPSAMISAMTPGGAVGGTVNVVPKRAGEADLTRVTASYLSDTRVGVHADVGRRFGDDGAWGVRINGAIRHGETSRDLQDQDHKLGAIALDYRGARLRGSIDYLYQSMHDNTSRMPLGIGAATAGFVPRPPAPETNFSQPWSWVKSGNRALVGRLEVDITSDISAHVAVGRSKGWFDGIGAGNQRLVSVTGDVAGAAGGSAFHLDTTAAELGVNGRVRTGPIQRQWAVSIGSVERKTSYGFSSTGLALATNLYQPVYVPEPVGLRPAEARLASASRMPSVAIADTMSFNQDQVRLSLGLRRQTVRTDNHDLSTGTISSRYDQSAVTPFAGLVVKPWAGGAIYANAIQGLTQGNVAPEAGLNAGEVLAPYKSRQYELGIKQEWSSLGASLSLFQITRPSGVLDTVSDRFVAAGRQRHRGVEAAIFGEVSPSLRLLGGVALIDARMSGTGSAATEGRRPVGAPRFTANLGGEWDVIGIPSVDL